MKPVLKYVVRKRFELLEFIVTIKTVTVMGFSYHKKSQSFFIMLMQI